MVVMMPCKLEPGRRANIYNVTHVLEMIDYEGRQAWRRAGGVEIFQIPDPATGFPMRPRHVDVLALMAEGDFELHPEDLTNPRAQARRQNQMHRAEARKLDPDSELRDRFLDAYHDNPCNLSDKALGLFWKDLLAADSEFERLARNARRAKRDKRRRDGSKLPWCPCGKTLRGWIESRGQAGDRQLRDCVSDSGRGPRKKKLHHPKEILEHWLGRTHASKRDTLAVHRRYDAEIERINRGEPTGRVDESGEPVVYPKPAKPYKALSYTTFWRLKRDTRSKTAKVALDGPHAADMDHGGGGRMEVASFFGDIVGIDDSPVPKLCKLEVNGLVWVGRPTLTIARDRFSGGFVGSDLSWDNASSSTVLRTILDVGTPKRVPPDMAATHPQLAMFCCNPVRVTVDNLLAHHHAHVEDSLREIGTDIDFTGAEKPRDKADVESGVGLVLAAAFKGGPGAVEAIPLRRHTKNDPPADQLPTLDGLRKVLDRTMATLNMAGSRGNMRRSPLAMLVSSMATRLPGIIADRARLTKAIGMVVFDVELRASGIELFGCLRYSEAKASHDLFDRLCHRVRPSKRTKTDTVTVKVKHDANDIGRVHVWDPSIKDWVTLECDQPAYADRLPKFIHDQILKDIAEDEAAYVSPSTLLEYRARLFEQVVEIAQEADAAERRRAANVMQSSIFKMTMGEYVEVLDEDEIDDLIDVAAFADMETTSGRMADWDRPTPRAAKGGAPAAKPTPTRRSGRTAPGKIARDRRAAAGDPDSRPARPRSAANRGLRSSG